MAFFPADLNDAAQWGGSLIFFLLANASQNSSSVIPLFTWSRFSLLAFSNSLAEKWNDLEMKRTMASRLASSAITLQKSNTTALGAAMRDEAVRTDRIRKNTIFFMKQTFVAGNIPGVIQKLAARARESSRD